MKRKFLDLSLAEIDAFVNEAWNNLTDEEKQALFQAANICYYMWPKLTSEFSWSIIQQPKYSYLKATKKKSKR